MHTDPEVAAPGAALRAGLATVAAGATTAALLIAAHAMAADATPAHPEPVGTVGAGGAVGANLAGLRLDELVGLAVVTVGAAAAGALTLGCLLLVAATLSPGRRAGHLTRWAHRLTPAVLRRAVAVGLGTGLGLLGPVAMAGATEIDLGWAVTTDGAGSERPVGAEVAETGPVAPSTAVPTLAANDVPVAGPGTGPLAPGPAPAPTTSAPEPGRTTVTVTPGDSLWSIAAEHLPPDASDGQIAAAWPRWYAANRALIGTDPGLVLPGQVLVAPAEPQATS